MQPDHGRGGPGGGPGGRGGGGLQRTVAKRQVTIANLDPCFFILTCPSS
jgi:hypothetical protein